MTTSIDKIELTQFTLDECARLAQRLWESVQRETLATPLSATQIEEIERRIAAADAGLTASMPWRELKRELLAE